MGSAKEEALRDGVDIDGGADNGLVKETISADGASGDSPAPKQDESQTPPDGGAKPVVTPPENVPFHKHPDWIKRERQFKDYQTRLEAAERKNQEFLEKMAFMNKPQGDAPMNPEASQALRQLATMLKNDPESAKMLGFSDIQQTRQQLETMQKAQVQASFNSEYYSVVNDDMASKAGMTKDELDESFASFLEENGLNNAYAPGKNFMTLAMNAYLYPKVREVTERELNARLLKEKTVKKSQNTETPSKSEQSPAREGRSAKERMEDMIRESGGIAV